jgi:hypothetical protein
MDNTHLFEGQEYPLTLYNTQPIIDLGFQFVYDDCGTETAFTFPGYEASYMRVYNERLGREIKEYLLTRSSNILILNTQDTDFDDAGDYFYEVLYVDSGGYEYVLRYGKLTVI